MFDRDQFDDFEALQNLLTLDSYDEDTYEEVLEMIGDDWTDISKFCYMSNEFISTFRNFLDWDYIGISCYAEEQHIYIDMVPRLCYIDEFESIDERREGLDLDFIERFEDLINWEVVSAQVVDMDYRLSVVIIDKYSNKLKWNIVSWQRSLDNLLVKNHYQYIHWDMLVLNDEEEEDLDYQMDPEERGPILESLISTHASEIINWEGVSYTVRNYYKYFSVEFILSIGDKLDWFIIGDETWGSPTLDDQIVITFYDKIPRSVTHSSYGHVLKKHVEDTLKSRLPNDDCIDHVLSFLIGELFGRILFSY